jgi:MFS family permease
VSDTSKEPLPANKNGRWINLTVVGIVLATFFSDFSHEMCTAVLPLYLASVGLGPAALGLIEGLADFLVSLSKLGGGVVGHHVRRKRPWASLGYLVTTLATAAIALVSGLAALVSLRSAAWVGRGFRGPLRDYLLADAVGPTHYGRAYGLERAGDMLGAVAGPLVAALLIWAGVGFRSVILWTLVPGLVAVAAITFLTRDRKPAVAATLDDAPANPRPPFPRVFWVFLVGVFLFGLGDFSRTFVIWLAARAVGEDGHQTAGMVSVAVLLYTLHNLVSAGAAYPTGYLGDRTSKLRILVGGYGLGVGTNLLLAILGGSLGWLVAAIVLSGVYIAVEETLEKAVAAELLPRELRSLGFGILACANAVGDMASSLYVGFLLQADRPGLAFGIAAAVGGLGFLWMVWLAMVTDKRGRSYLSKPS